MEMEWVWFLLLGMGTGAFGVMTGTGGGVIMVPVLLLLFDMEPTAVAGTSLALVAVTSFSGSVAYLRRRLVDKRSGLLFAAAALPGSVVAPFAVKEVGGDVFRALFGVLLLSLAVHTLVKTLRRVEEESAASQSVKTGVRTRHITDASGQNYDYRFNEALAAAFNFVVGFVSAFFGTGGGFLRTPVLVSVFGFPVRVAVATSIFALAMSATAGAGVHALLGHVVWYPTFVFAGLGLLIGSQAGVRLAGGTWNQWTMRMLIALLTVMGARLLFDALMG
jgi:uncharacterized membrane protein YfcA